MLEGAPITQSSCRIGSVRRVLTSPKFGKCFSNLMKLAAFSCIVKIRR